MKALELDVLNVYKMLLKGAAVDITDFMGSKAKGTDNPVGLNCFRMCAFHHRFCIFLQHLYMCCCWPPLIILGVSVGPSRKWQYTFSLTKSKSDWTLKKYIL